MSPPWLQSLSRPRSVLTSPLLPPQPPRIERILLKAPIEACYFKDRWAELKYFINERGPRFSQYLEWKHYNWPPTFYFFDQFGVTLHTEEITPEMSHSEVELLLNKHGFIAGNFRLGADGKAYGVLPDVKCPGQE